jgi:glycosyltransferase involved in cell wall biosynthesis
MFGLKGGIQVYQYDLMRALRSLLPSARLDVFIKNDATIPAHQQDLAGVGFHYAGSSGGRARTARFLYQILSRAIVDRPELVILGHLHFAGAALALKRLTGVPYWVVTYGVEAWNLRQPVLRRALHEAALVIAIGEHTRTRLLREQGLDPSRVVLLAPTFDDNTFKPGPKPHYLFERYSLRPDQPVLLTVARLAGAERYKGYDQILAALPRVRAVYPDVRYILVGTGDDRARIEAMIRQQGVEDNVTLAGFVPDGELCDHYNLCDVFAMPSKREGFGIVFVEAMACGKPVLAGNQDGAVDALNRGEFGALVDPDDVDAIATGLIELLRGRYPAPLMSDGPRLREAVVARFGPNEFSRMLRGHLDGMTTRG